MRTKSPLIASHQSKCFAGAVYALLLAALAGGCKTEAKCEPDSIRLIVHCPKDVSVKVFKVDLTRDDGPAQALDDLTATCPATFATVKLAGYADTKRAKIELTPVNQQDELGAPLVGDSELSPGCTIIEVAAPTTTDDGGADPIDGPLTDGGSQSCSAGEKRCAELVPESCENGVWVASAECPNLCRDGVCTGQCRPQTKVCQFMTPFACSSDGTPTPGPVCPNLCKGGTCTGDCKPRDRRCNDNNIPQTCDETGTWQDGTACQATCMDGFCSGCMSGTTMCNGDTVYNCNAQGLWAKGTACPFFCDAASGKCAGDCQPGMVRCGANEMPQTCDAKGAWKDAGEACRYVCKEGICAGECKPGTPGMCAAGNTPRLCGKDGVLTTEAACPYVCKDGTCTGACVPGRTQCSPQGTALQLCDAAGVWNDMASCGSGCLANACNLCKPSTSQCTGAGDNDAQECGADGKWGAAKTCATGCSGGACNDCSGPPRCTNDGNVQECVGGKYTTPTSCSGKGCRSGKCNACTPGLPRCTEGVAYKCLDDGSADTTVKACGAPGCNDTSPICNTCVPDQITCTNGVRSVCAKSGLSATTTTCNLGCNANGKDCNVCTPGRSCSGTTLLVCADGSGQTSKDCSPQQCNTKLNPIECNVCTPTDRRCTGSGGAGTNVEDCPNGNGWVARSPACASATGCNLSTKDCNQCLPGDTRCTGGQISTCRSDGTGYDTADCPSGQFCSGKACTSCAAAPAVCGGKVGSYCSDTTVVTCGTDAMTKCLVQTATLNCQSQTPANGAPTCSGGVCSYTCPTACAPTSKVCGPNGGFQTCGSEACRVYGAETACGSRQVCGGGVCSCRAPESPCSAANTSVCTNSTTKATCSEDANGCIYVTGATSCAGGNGTPACTGTGVCSVACNAGFSSCDASSPDCETDITNSNANCGSCGRSCGVGGTCVSKKCVYTAKVFGTIASSGLVRTDGVVLAGSLSVGELSSNNSIGQRSFFTFDLPIPANANIDQATFGVFTANCFKAQLANTFPTQMGSVILEAVSFASFDASIFNTTPLTSPASILNADNFVSFSKFTLSVTSQAAQGFASPSRKVQFRLRFSVGDTDPTNGVSAKTDLCGFQAMSPAGHAAAPYLDLQYSVP